MLHQRIITILTQIRSNNTILYIILLFLLSYLLLGISAGILFLLTINLKEICILTTITKIKDKITGTIYLIILWPFGLMNMYELWYNFCMYISCLISGSTFRRNIMNDKNVAQIKYLVNNTRGEISFKKLATTNMGCIEELITEGEHKGDTFVTIYGLDEKPKSQIVPQGISFCSVTTLDFLKELKVNGLMGLQKVEANKEIKFDFSANDIKLKDFNLVFPEAVFCYIFEDINTVYVTKAIDLESNRLDNIDNPSLMEFKDQLYNEVHINNDSILFMIDYTQHESYALDYQMNEIMNCEFEGNDPEDQYKKVRIGDTVLRYVYNPIGYLDRIIVDKTDKEFDYGYYLKVNECDDSNSKHAEHLTITYMVPYLRDTGNVFVYSENCRIYRTDNIYIERGKILEWQIDYRILSDSEEQYLNDAFAKTVKNSEYIVD